MTLRIGSLVYATEQGLGILARDFFDNGIITDPVIVRHGRHPNRSEWYPKGTPVIADLRRDTARLVEPVLREVDAMLFFETPFQWPLIRRCRELGVKTVLMPMFECEPERLPEKPDLFLNPSLLDQVYYPEGVFLPVPVNTNLVPWRQRTEAKVFVHNAGHGGLKGRNGTAETAEAMKYVKSPARLLLRAQESSRQYWAAGQLRDANDHPTNLSPNIDLRIGTVPYGDLWQDGDVFLFPEGFNGLSLPLQEACASGMLVMCGDRFPMNTWLPREPLIPVAGYRKERIGPPYNEYDRACFSPREIAAKIDEWYGRDISAYSESGKAWAESMSWQALKPKYLEVLEALCG